MVALNSRDLGPSQCSLGFVHRADLNAASRERDGRRICDQQLGRSEQPRRNFGRTADVAREFRRGSAPVCPHGATLRYRDCWVAGNGQDGVEHGRSHAV